MDKGVDKLFSYKRFIRETPTCSVHTLRGACERLGVSTSAELDQHTRVGSRSLFEKRDTKTFLNYCPVISWISSLISISKIGSESFLDIFSQDDIMVAWSRPPNIFPILG